VWLTVPLLLLAFSRRRAWQPRPALSVAGAYAAGVVIWALPLLLLSGGPRAYWNAVAFQGGADLSGVTMLWTNPTPRQLVAAFEYGFLHPWGWWPLAAAVIACAVVGAAWLLVKAPRAAATVAAAFGPYLIFDMLFQRPDNPLRAAARGAGGPPRRGRPRGNQPMGCAGGRRPRWRRAGGGHPTSRYASDAAPAFRMLADMRAESSTAPARRSAFIVAGLRFEAASAGWARCAGVFRASAAPPKPRVVELVSTGTAVAAGRSGS
jgi:hypothetical protein